MGEDLNSLKICINVTGGGNIHPILPVTLQHTTYLKKTLYISGTTTGKAGILPYENLDTWVQLILLKWLCAHKKLLLLGKIPDYRCRR